MWVVVVGTTRRYLWGRYRHDNGNILFGLRISDGDGGGASADGGDADRAAIDGGCGYIGIAGGHGIVATAGGNLNCGAFATGYLNVVAGNRQGNGLRTDRSDIVTYISVSSIGIVIVCPILFQRKDAP